jgi:predicted dehydrogenase
MRADDSIYCAAIGSRSLEKATAFALAHAKRDAPAIKPFGSYDEAINDPSVHAVYVGVPTGVEEELVIKCLEAGKHVIADKPFLNAQSVLKIHKLAAEKNLLVMDATHFVHNERSHLIKEKVKEGIIGELVSISANFFTSEMPGGNIRLDPKMEPAGAVGDLGWYTARAAVEFLLLNDASVKVCLFIVLFLFS